MEGAWTLKLSALNSEEPWELLPLSSLAAESLLPTRLERVRQGTHAFFPSLLIPGLATVKLILHCLCSRDHQQQEQQMEHTALTTQGTILSALHILAHLIILRTPCYGIIGWCYYYLQILQMRKLRHKVAPKSLVVNWGLAHNPYPILEHTTVWQLEVTKSGKEP